MANRSSKRRKKTLRIIPNKPAQRLPYRLRQVPIKQIRVWKEAQARSLDREGVKELAKSIKTEGLQNPPLVQRDGKDSYLLMSGQRRLAALKRLRAKTIPVLVLSQRHDIENAKASSLIENLHRRNMNVKETAKACEFLAETMGKTRGAKMLGISLHTFKKYLGFAAVPDKLKELVPKVITRDQATRLYQIVPNVNDALKIAYRISNYDSPTARRYLQALSEDPKASHAALLRRAKKYQIKKRVTVKLPNKKARGLAKESEIKGLEPEFLANKIVHDWLSRRGY